MSHGKHRVAAILIKEDGPTHSKAHYGFPVLADIVNTFHTMAPHTTGSLASSSASSSATRSSDKDREHRARLQACYVTQEPFQIAYLQEQQQREREAKEQEMAMRDAVDRANAEEQPQKETSKLCDCAFGCVA